MTMADLYKEYGLSEDTIDFIGHSLALHRDDAYLTQPAFFTVMKARDVMALMIRVEVA